MQLHAAIFTVKSTVNHVTSAAMVQAGYTYMPGMNIIFGQHVKKTRKALGLNISRSIYSINSCSLNAWIVNTIFILAPTGPRALFGSVLPNI